jgi:chitinase
MIGRNDVPGEIFHQDDARQLLAFATASDLALVSFWSLNRDRPCEQPTASANPSCSGIAQAPEEFSRLFQAFPVRTTVVAAH